MASETTDKLTDIRTKIDWDLDAARMAYIEAAQSVIEDLQRGIAQATEGSLITASPSAAAFQRTAHYASQAATLMTMRRCMDRVEAVPAS